MKQFRYLQESYDKKEKEFFQKINAETHPHHFKRR